MHTHILKHALGIFKHARDHLNRKHKYGQKRTAYLNMRTAHLNVAGGGNRTLKYERYLNLRVTELFRNRQGGQFDWDVTALNFFSAVVQLEIMK